MYSSEECFCGSLYPGHPAREEDCDKTCKGNNSLMCRGGGGTVCTVYMTGYQYSVQGGT